MRHSSYLEVNLDILAQNFQKVQALAPTSEIMPMVKADAYGNGILPVSQFLIEECGVRSLGCSSLGEALTIFNECPSLNAEMLVFSDTELQDSQLRRAYLDLNITPVIHCTSDLEAILNDPDFKKVPLVLKLDSGMNRLGLTIDELSHWAPRLKSRQIRHLMTHFACSYQPLKVGDRTNRQYETFLKAKNLMADLGISIPETSVANSGAIEQGIGISESHVRPGLMLYGPASVEHGPWGGRQISRLVTKVIKTSLLKKGVPVGYGTHVLAEDALIAVIPLGYGDGLMTFASGSELTINGQRGKLFARINMDMTFIAFHPSAEGIIKSGDVIEIWNHDNKVITDLATQMKTVPYQIMCGISGRIPKIYKVK